MTTISINYSFTGILERIPFHYDLYLRTTVVLMGYYVVHSITGKSLAVYFIHVTIFQTYWNWYVFLRCTGRYIPQNMTHKHSSLIRYRDTQK